MHTFINNFFKILKHFYKNLTNYSTYVTEISFEVSKYRNVNKISRNFLVFTISTTILF